MDNKELIKKLSNLVQLDVDAVEAYEQALKNIDIPLIHTKISGFRDDHLRHINNLSEIIRRLGGQPPERTKDLKGFLIKGFTAIRSATGTKGALNAMESNEKLTNSTYEDALSWDLTADVKAVVRQNYEDEKRHLAYIKDTLKSDMLK